MQQKFEVSKFYIYKFLNDCLPIYALYTILFKEKGLSVTEISLLLAIWSLVTLVIEVPSGILADRWNRKYMLSIATLLKAVCYIIWFFSSSFVMFAVGFLFWGFESAFTSGTEEGLLYDNLKSENRETEFSKIYGRGRFYSNLGTLLGVLSGGILANFISINILSIISAAALIINLFFVNQLKETNYYSDKRKKENAPYFSTLSEAIKLCLKNTNVFIGMLLLILIISVVSYMDEYDSLIINDFGLSYIWLSIILGVRFIFIALGNCFAERVEKRFNIKNKIFVLAAIASLFLLIFSIIWNKYVIIIYGIFCMIMSIAEIIQTDIIQNEIIEEGRTTVMSLLGLLQNLTMIIYSLVYAVLADNNTLKECYIIISLYCIIGIAGLSLANTIMQIRRYRTKI